MGLRWPQIRQQNGVTLRPPIKGRIPPINGSTPVALYQWNLLERQKPGIPLIKGIATLILQEIIVFVKSSTPMQSIHLRFAQESLQRFLSPPLARPMFRRLFLLVLTT
jgi:hypothetical protein